ncbi:DUF3987 domain-containing protein [Nonomuraea zeae]|uniref:DUF3987 domain-containing protein n=1 Tax=Nonomuraea zeae TaxID=1642303 RepID=UPI00361791C6
MTLVGRPVPDPVIYRGPLGQITRSIEPYTDSDPIGIHASVLALLGAIVGREPHVEFEAYQPLLIWPILLGDTNLGRKGSATNHAIRLFETAFPKFMQQRVQPSLPASGAAIISGTVTRAIRLEGADAFEDNEEYDMEDDEGEAGPPKSGVKTYVSKPGFRGAWLAREMKTFLQRSKMDSTMAGTLREMWEGQRVDSETKKEHYALVDPHVALICHIPPEEFVLNYSASDAAGGSMNRMLPIFVHRSKILKFPRKLPASVMDKNVRALIRMVEFAEKCGELEPDAAALKLWDERLWEELDTESNKNKIMKQFAGRVMPYTWRLAGLYALGRCSSTISVADLESAAAVAQYMMKTVEHVFNEYQVETKAMPERKVEPFPFDGDPSLAKEAKVAKLVEIAKAAGEAGEKSGKFLQNMNIDKDMLNHVGAAAQAQGLVKRYRLSRGSAGGHTYLIVYTGPTDEESPVEEMPKPAKRFVAPVEVAEERLTPEPAAVVTPKRAASPVPSPQPKIRTKPLPAQAKVAPKPPVKKVNGGGSSGLLAGFFS